jgi:TonB-linked SusC/RagA family outer membrane protein
MNMDLYKQKNLKSGLRLLVVACLFLLQVHALAADVTVSGRITDAADGSPLPGVSVIVKGTQNGTTTDTDGKYALSVAEGATLVFSFIGFLPQEIQITGRTVIDVSMAADSKQLDEVVVTALGIERAEQSLGFSYSKVKGGDVTGVAQENVLNGLAAKVPGVTINSTGGAGSSVMMNIRGVRSLTGDNQPLFVIDGVQVNNSLGNISQIGADNKVDYGNAISDINPENIESVTVLKGPSAAALYGSRAGNGVVLITTKSGSKAKKFTVSVTSNTVLDRPFKNVDFISSFAQGARPFTPDNNPYPGGILQVDNNSGGSLGPELNKGYYAAQFGGPKDANGATIPTLLKSHPDNFKNFFQTGVTSTNDVSIANSTDKATYRLAYSNMNSRGIIPGSDLKRNVLNLNSSFNVTPKLKVSSMVDLSRTNSDNRPAGNRGTNPLQWLAYFPSQLDIRDFKNYWEPGQVGVQQYSPDHENYNNPYFLAHQVQNGFTRDRIFGNVKVDYKITDKLSIMGRYALDTYHEQRETKIGQSYTGQPRGAYGIINIQNYERNADFLLNYDDSFGDLNLTASIGGNNRYYQSFNSQTGTVNGGGLILPNVYTLTNISPLELQYNSYLNRAATNSVYGLVNLGYKSMIFLDLTARNDWSSTLPANNRSYFYPSASLSVVANHMFHMPDVISLLKVRGGVAQVGNGTSPYNLYNTLSTAESWGGVTRLYQPDVIKTPTLKPEQITSYEGGLDFNLFGDRLRFIGTYYNTRSVNQILSNPISSTSGGSSLIYNAGLVVSKGLELSLGGTPINQSNGFRLDVNVNYSRNRSFIDELSAGQDKFTFWTDARGGAWSFVGDRIGDIYDAKIVTVTDKNSPYYGYPILDNTGFWQSTSATANKNKIGNYNPDFLMGMQSTLSYKRFSLSFSIDWRKGGVFVSQTMRYTESDSRSQRQLDALINPNGLSGDALANWLKADPANRIIPHGNVFPIVGGPSATYGGLPDYAGAQGDGVMLNDGAFIPGVIAQYDTDGNIVGYTENLGAQIPTQDNPTGTQVLPFAAVNTPWDFTQAATFDASFIKLREISIGYAIPSSITQRIGVSSANFSIYSRNIMLWTAAKINIDPETAFQQETSAGGNNSSLQFKQGIERYNVNPWVLPIGFKLNLTF